MTLRDVRMRGFRHRTPVEEALAVLAARTPALGAERAHVREAGGRVAAEDVTARSSVPHFTRSAMDGYAVVAESTRNASSHAPVELAVLGAAYPGRPFAGVVRRGEAVRITTGAPLPEGADAVLMAEKAEEQTRDDGVFVRLGEAILPKKHVGEIGEDVRAGAVVVRRGRRLRPQDLGVLASVGTAEVLVVRRPRVRVLVTGDELLPPGSAPEGSRIVDSNSVVLEALVARDGGTVTRVEYVADGFESVKHAMGSADEDVLLVSGGSSVGPEDHAPHVLASVGELAVHGVAMRPGSPAGFGFLGARPVFLLPGNPVACLCAYEHFAGPSLRALGGRPRAWPHPKRSAALAAKIVSELGRVDYVRVRFEGERVLPIATSGASILSSTTRADGVVLVPAEVEGLAEGQCVEVLLYE
jgi:molybdopterin molybdotransferase